MMYKDIARLVLYRDLNRDSILTKVGDIIEDFELEREEKPALVSRCYTEIKRILDISTSFGFDRNLWQDYLTYVLVTHENSFTLTCEKVGAGDGTVNGFAKHDYEIFMKLFHYDFTALEQGLSIDCFSVITDYKSIPKREQIYNKNVSDKVRALSDKLSKAVDSDEFFGLMTDFYRDYGVGLFGLNKAFRVSEAGTVQGGGTAGGNQMGSELSIAYGGTDVISFTAITNTDPVRLTDLVGYEIQKKKLMENTEAFVAGRRANNCLLFGDSGTGKSTSIKALINEYYDRGLRMIEIYKHQMKLLPLVISEIKNRNYRFIIYMDDLSFEDFETDYKYLKAVIEGGLEHRPENVLIYATSNRRHLIRESWDDRSDVKMENGMHQSDTMQEKLSLANRFGVTISYSRPSKKEFNLIVTELKKRYPEIKLSDEEIVQQANAWELSHGGISGRTAQQFIDHLAGCTE